MHTGYKNQKGFMVNLGLEPKTNSLSWWEKTKIYNKDQDSSLQGLENFSKHGTKYLATKHIFLWTKRPMPKQKTSPPSLEDSKETTNCDFCKEDGVAQFTNSFIHPMHHNGSKKKLELNVGIVKQNGTTW